MKKIILDKPEKKQALQAELDQVQARCTARTLSAYRIERILNGVESELGISKKAMTGVHVHFNGGEPFPNAYRYIPEATHFSADYNGRAWVVTDVWRETCPSSYKNTELTLSDSAKAALIDKFSRIYT